MHEYDLDIVHRVGKVNQGVDGLSWNSSFNEKDTMGAYWRGDVNFQSNYRLACLCIRMFIVGMFWGCTSN